MSGTTTRTRLRAATGGAAATPLVILFLFNLVDEFDRVAFGVLSPEIRDTFDLSDSGIVGIGSVVGITSLLAALPIGVLADRFKRVRMAGIAAATWAVTAVITAVAPNAAVLTIARTVGGVGRVTNEPVHASLLTDYYAPTTHPRVFALHRLANPIGLSSALVIGLLATTFDWRVVMGILAVPTIVLLPALLRLREPARGETVDPNAAARAAELGTVSFGEARRQLFAVKTLRRLWVPLPVLGIADPVARAADHPVLRALLRVRPGGTRPGDLPVRARHRRSAWRSVSGWPARRSPRASPELLATYDGMAIVCIGVGHAGHGRGAVGVAVGGLLLRRRRGRRGLPALLLQPRRHRQPRAHPRPGLRLRAAVPRRRRPVLACCWPGSRRSRATASRSGCWPSPSSPAATW